MYEKTKLNKIRNDKIIKKTCKFCIKESRSYAKYLNH